MNDVGPWTLLNASLLASLSLSDVSYVTTFQTNTVVRGSFDAGPFSTLNAHNLPQTVPSTMVETALFLPSGTWNAGGFGMVIAASLGSSPDAPSESMLQDLASELNLPILAAWFNVSLPRAFGYKGMNGISAVTLRAMPFHTPCHLTNIQDLRWGNFNILLAKKQMIAITVLQRLVEQHGGDSNDNNPNANAGGGQEQQPTVSSVALSGSSKDGGAAWAAAVSDPRIRVAAAMHDQAQNLSAYLDGIESSWGCQFECQLGPTPGTPYFYYM